MTFLRALFGLLLILHGLAHASAGMWATDIGGRTLVTVLWEGATIGFMLSGAAVLGVSPLQKWWRALIGIAVACSLLLLLLFGHPLFVAGIAADFFIAAIAIASLARGGDTKTWSSPRWLHYALVALLVYTGGVIALRPWYSSWGATRSEQQMPMIGDPPLGESHYRIDHAITISAPVDSVWPWLVQLGQEDLGQRITELQPGRAMVLKGWGAFMLEPLGPSSTRMHIRTRGEGIPTLTGIAITPLGLLVFEPAHFIMERGMMRGIKHRAERRRSL